MIIQIDDWKFRVLTVSNRRYYVREVAEHCTCAWCRNFYQSVDDQYPDLRSFLDRFGIHIEAPAELLAPNPMLCSCYYGVYGEILEQGSGDILVNGVAISPQTPEEAMVNTDMEGPIFFLQVGCMTLPWVLDEPIEEAESPAKSQNFIQRLLRRWITE